MHHLYVFNTVDFARDMKFYGIKKERSMITNFLTHFWDVVYEKIMEGKAIQFPYGFGILAVVGIHRSKMKKPIINWQEYYRNYKFYKETGRMPEYFNPDFPYFVFLKHFKPRTSSLKYFRLYKTVFARKYRKELFKNLDTYKDGQFFILK